MSYVNLSKHIYTHSLPYLLEQNSREIQVFCKLAFRCISTAFNQFACFSGLQACIMVCLM